MTYAKVNGEVWKVPESHQDGDESVRGGERYTWWMGQWRRDTEMDSFPSFKRKENQGE